MARAYPQALHNASSRNPAGAILAVALVALAIVYSTLWKAPKQ
jgi:cytochrome b